MFAYIPHYFFWSPGIPCLQVSAFCFSTIWKDRIYWSNSIRKFEMQVSQVISLSKIEELRYSTVDLKFFWVYEAMRCLMMCYYVGSWWVCMQDWCFWKEISRPKHRLSQWLPVVRGAIWLMTLQTCQSIHINFMIISQAIISLSLQQRLTQHLHKFYLSNRVYYAASVLGGLSNPDQVSVKFLICISFDLFLHVWISNSAFMCILASLAYSFVTHLPTHMNLEI